MGLECYPKTSGSKGIRLLFGIRPDYDFEEARSWVLAVAKVLAGQSNWRRSPRTVSPSGT
jgi:DNA primase